MWISPTRLELAVYRVCVYISLMTSGELVRFYSLSVAQSCQKHQQEFCVLHIWTIILDKQNYCLF